ncbi:MAG TPA: hypothetical protein PLJ38_06665, partial [bacterium]|nr:hypothetical protein [bacterium]
MIEKQYFYSIPNLFAVSNTVALMQQDFSTITENLTAMMNNFHDEFSLGYVSILDMSKRPIKTVISNEFKDKTIDVLRKKLDKQEELVKVRDEYKLFSGENIKEVLVTVGTPPVGIVRIGYIWDKVEEKTRVLQFALLSVTIIAIVIMIIIAIYLNNTFNTEVSSYFFAEKKKVIETTKQHTIKEFEMRQSEKLKKQLETDLTQSEIFSIIEMNKQLFISTDFNENLKIICEWLRKIFVCKEVMIYLIDDSQQFLYGVYGIDASGVYIEGQAAYDRHIIIGEGELGLAVQHNNFVISDVPRSGYELSGPLIYNDKIIGGITVSNKVEQLKKFDAHDKLVG